MTAPEDGDPLDPVDALVVQLLREPVERRGASLDHLCAEQPIHAAALRRRYAFLRDAGLLEAELAATVPLPARIGGHRILRRLGTGGMGVVYLAEQEPFGRLVALKVLRPELLAEPHARERFRREALAAGGVDHPGICAVHDFGDDAGQPYLVLRYVPGRTLAAHLHELARRRQQPDVRSMVALVEKIARALAAAHARGLVHRDVKPANIQLDDRGEPVLLDFGLSLLTDTAAPRLTASDSVLGTPIYLAPEQIDARANVGPQTDVYALAVVLHECLTLHPPFAAPTRDRLYRLILGGVREPARRLHAGVGRDLQLVLDVAMERDLGRRYASATAFSDDLLHVLRAEPIAARPLPAWLRARRWCQRNPFAATAAATLLCGLTAVALLLVQSRQAARATAASNAARAFWELKDHEPDRAVAAALAAQDAPSPETDAALRAALTLPWPEFEQLPPEMLGIAFALDPRQERAVWIDQRGGGWLWRLGSGGVETRQFPVQSLMATQVQFAPDGRRFAVAGNDFDDTAPSQQPSVTLLDRDGKLERKLGPLPGGAMAVAWHPRLPLLAVGCRDFDGDGPMRNAVVVWDLEHDRIARSIPQPTVPWLVTCTDDARILVATGAHFQEWTPAIHDAERFPVSAYSFDGKKLGGHELHDKPVFRMAAADGWLLTGGHDRRAVLWHHARSSEPPVVLEGHGGAVCGVAFAADGTIVTASLDEFVRWFDRAGHLLAAFAIGARPDNVLVVPATGELLVPCLDGCTRLFAPNGQLLRRFPMQRNGHPGDTVRLLPDRRVLISNLRGPASIRALDAVHRRGVPGADLVLPSPSAAGVAVELEQPLELQLRIGDQQPLRTPLTAHVAAIAFSPDSRWLAAGTNDGEVIVGDLARRRFERLPRRPRGVQALAFAADGSVFCIALPDGWVRVYRCGNDDVWRDDGGCHWLQDRYVAHALPFCRDGRGELHLLLQTPSGCGVWHWAAEASEHRQWLTSPAVEGVVYSTAASRDGRRLALACQDHTVRLFAWSGEHAEPIAAPLRHERSLSQCAFDATGDLLVTIDDDRFAWVWRWNADPGQPMTCVRSPEDHRFVRACFGIDGREIVTVDDTQAVERWPLDLRGSAIELQHRWQLPATR